MDAFVDTLVQLLIDWGYVGLFISALLAGSIIPFSSEIVMVALVKVGLSPALLAFFAFLPFVGEAIAIALGFMRSNLMLTTTSMFAGKLVRYIAMLWALQGAISMMNY